MQNIQRSGRTNELFAEELKKRLPAVQAEEKDTPNKDIEKQLADDRKDKSQEAVTEGTHEVQLDSDRKGPEEPALYEKLLEGHREKEAGAITEKRLNDAPAGGLYPHRNPKAHERTGDKRPINALPEELGSASDKAKRERYEKAAKGGEPRLLDENVGEQLTNEKTTIKAFNRSQQKTAEIARFKGYVAYKDSTDGGIKTASQDKFAEVKKLDTMMSSIMEIAQASNRALNDDERAQIAAMKIRKSSLLLK